MANLPPPTNNRVQAIGNAIYQRIYHQILPISGDSPQENQRSTLLNITILVSLFACIGISLLFLFIPDNGAEDYKLAVTIAFVGLAASYLFYRNEWLSLAAWSTNITILLAISIGVLFSPISSSLAAVSLMIVITISALTISDNVAIAIATAAAAVLLIATITDWTGGSISTTRYRC